MLTTEILKSNEALKGLSEDQLKVITTLSSNDENAVIAKRIGELHGQYDADIFSVSGMEKQQGEKSYNYAKRVIDVLKKSGDKGELTKKLESLTAEKTELENKLKAGITDGSALKEFEQKLKDEQNRFNQLQEKYNADLQAKEEAIKKAQADTIGLKIEHEFTRSLTDVKFKDESFIPKEVRETFLQNAMGKLTSSYTPDWINDGEGGQVLVFRDENGQTLNNPENGLRPYTAAELLRKEIAPIIDTGKQQGGAGTKGGNGKPGGAFMLNGAKNQVEADKEIHEHLVTKGIAKGTQKYIDESQKLRQESGVEKLPLF